jgi:nicotinamidase-related amidase
MPTDTSDVIEIWDQIDAPSPPKLRPVTLDPAVTALLLLDLQNSNCNLESRPRCVATLAPIQELAARARAQGVPVVYSLTRVADVGDIRPELSPEPGDPLVRSSVDKFYGTALDVILRGYGAHTLIIVGTSAHGAVLHTATSAATRDFNVIVPVDGLSADDAYAEQYTCWHLANAPGSRQRVTLTRCADIAFETG